MTVSTHRRGFSIERIGRLKTFAVAHQKYGFVGYYRELKAAREHIASCHRAFRRMAR